MNEAETRAELIDPALRDAGWGVVEGSRIEIADRERYRVQLFMEAIDQNRDREKPRSSPLPRHLAYGSVPRRLDRVECQLKH